MKQRLLTVFKRPAYGWRLCFAGLSLLDALLTALTVPFGLVELNPLVAPLLDQPATFVAVKGFAPVIIAAAVPGLLLLPSIALLAALSGWNLLQLAAHFLV